MLNPALDPPVPQLFLKDAGTRQPISIDRSRLDDDEGFGGIRCPLCNWRPSAASRWYCDCGNTPEPFFVGCGAEWNTFATRGRCPGCQHQWRWTSCLQCHESSLHQDWYEPTREDH